MKKIWNLWNIAFLFSILLCSCGDDEGNDATIKVPDEKELNQKLAANQTQSSVHLVAQGDWSSSIDVSTRAENSWVSLSPDHGTAGTYDIVIKLEPNVTGKERKAVITIVCGDYRITIIIIQTPVNDPDLPPVTPPSDVKYLLTKVTLMENDTEKDEEYLITYDDQNRPVKMITRWWENESGTGNWEQDTNEFTYQNGKVTEHYDELYGKGSERTVSDYQYTLDAEGRIQSWNCKTRYNGNTFYENGTFTYGSNGEILRDDYLDDNKWRYAYARWENGNKVRQGWGDVTNKEDYYDLLTYTSYPNNPQLNVDLNLFLHNSEAGYLCFANEGRLKLFGNYLGTRSKNYLKSYAENYSFNGDIVDLTTLEYEFDDRTGLPVKVTATKTWNVNGKGESDTDYYLLEYEPAK